MFKVKHLIPFCERVDSEEYIKTYSYRQRKLKKFCYVDDKFERMNAEEEGKLHNSLRSYTVIGRLDYNETMTRFLFKLRVEDAKRKDEVDTIIDDTYPICIDKSHKLDSDEKRLVLMSLYKKLMAIALNDIRLFQPGSIYLYGVDGFCFQKTPLKRTPMTKKAMNLNTKFRRRYHSKIDIESYYDSIIDTLFEKIFSFNNEENPIYQLNNRMVFHNEETCELCSKMPEIIERRFSSTGTLRHRLVEQSFDPRHDNRSRIISGNDLIPIYYYPDARLCRFKHINRDRKMDLYIDLIVNFINNDFNVDKTLREYEYRRRRINHMKSKDYNPDDEEYVRFVDNEDGSISEPYRNYPCHEGMSHTISYLYDHRIELTVPDFKKILFDSMVPAVIVYTDSTKTKIDKEWLMSQNAKAFFNTDRLDEYKSNLINDEAESWGDSNALFAPSQQVSLTEYKEKLIYEYNSILKENLFLDNETIFQMIDTRLPQPIIRHYGDLRLDHR